MGIPRPTILDGLTRIDNLLVENVGILRSLQAFLSREEERETRAVYFTYPDDGTLVTLLAGTTVLNFRTGTIEDVDHSFTNMGHSLQSEGRDWLRSFFIYSNKDSIIQPDSYDKIPASEAVNAIGTYQEFTQLKITCIEETQIFVICSTSPETIIQLVPNITVLINELQDNISELAGRLGSIDVFDNRGTIMFADDFKDDTSKWDVDGNHPGYGYSANRSIEQANTGDYSTKLITSSVLSDAVWMYIYLPVPVKSRFGAEFAFTIGDYVNYLEFRLNVYDGDYLYWAQVQYYPYAYDLKIMDDEPAWQTIDNNLILKRDNAMFHHIKFVYDLITEKWVRLLVNEEEYDISDYNLRKTGAIEAGYLMPHVTIQNSLAGNRYCYIDNVIITKEEPL